MAKHGLELIGWRRIALDEIDSTNTEALRRAAAGEHGPMWITAGLQTRGRGRSGRVWSSADGSVAATLLLSPDCPLGRLPELALVAGVAAHDAIAARLPVPARERLRLKWPNDVLLGGRKVCGVLVESTSTGARCVAAIGIGINVLAVPHLDGRQAAALSEQGARMTVEDMEVTLAHRLAHWLGVWNAGHNFESVRQSWLERAGALGEVMTVNAGDGPVSGAFAGLDSDGALLLDEDRKGIRRFSFGDVTLAQP